MNQFWNLTITAHDDPAPASGPTLSRGLVLFTVSYLLVGTVAGLASGVPALHFYGAVLAVLVALVAYLHSRFDLSNELLWALSIWGLLHTAGGIVPIPGSWSYEAPHPVLYSWWLIPDLLKYDNIVHAFGFGVTAWLCWEVLSHGFRKRYGVEIAATPGTLVLCGLGGMGFGAVNELVEFIATLLMADPRVGGYVNTGWDFVSNTIGCIVAMSLVWWRHSQRNVERPAIIARTARRRLPRRKRPSRSALVGMIR